MSRKARVVLFWLGVMMFVCCGCRWCGTDFEMRSILMSVESVAEVKDKRMTVKPAAKVDMTIEDERGNRERFILKDAALFQDQCFKFCLSKWKSKSDNMRASLTKDLLEFLQNFSVNSRNAISIGGLKIVPSSHYLRGGEAAY